ncbi:hypothetical protein OZX69_09525 (plasmid) [Lactobacillus sp. ESL0731]|uniref:hypothetical protein n=1 Tax=unclassified Lactobacillus TaxID=2620435 RepID=UPI0023F9FD0F|nr:MULTISPECIES: hypothetical protein [unclassified Lactobacillus]WEV52118.1 hypothetical protein OZX63_09505 [Lactobacillus sp. ESL0700]WEV63249.1 hypothetical protein OZX69_09525 [Lactobacillus sp. ESL0731]
MSDNKENLFLKAHVKGNDHYFTGAGVDVLFMRIYEEKNQNSEFAKAIPNDWDLISGLENVIPENDLDYLYRMLRSHALSLTIFADEEEESNNKDPKNRVGDILIEHLQDHAASARNILKNVFLYILKQLSTEDFLDLFDEASFEDNSLEAELELSFVSKKEFEEHTNND